MPASIFATYPFNTMYGLEIPPGLFMNIGAFAKLSKSRTCAHYNLYRLHQHQHQLAFDPKTSKDLWPKHAFMMRSLPATIRPLG